MKSLFKFVLVASLAGVIAGCGPHGNKNDRNQNQMQSQNTSMQDMGGRHRGGGGLRRICANDIQKYCAGQTKLGRCLRENSTKLESACSTALQQMKERRRERKIRDRTNNQTTNPTNGTQPQNQMAPQNGQQNNQHSPNNDDDDE
jgi:hypothetical protein